MWENGVPTDLGNIGGDAWNTPTAINNQGTIVGFANTAPGAARVYEAFVWTKAAGMKSLGKIPGDLRSTANGINEKGQIVVRRSHLCHGRDIQLTWPGIENG